MAVQIPQIQLQTAKLPNGVNIFYRSAGSTDQQVILLLHGFPASSFQYRNLIPILASHGYRVIAPDLPAFGLTTFPEGYKHTFDNMSLSIESFVDLLGITKFTAYVFDYGAPTLFRLALRRPELISAIVTQNGNAYAEGLGAEPWAPVKQLWKTNSDEDLKKVSDAFLAFDSIKWQYEDGVPASLLSKVDPVTYNLDFALIQKPGQHAIQAGIYYDYRTNVELYPKFHEYFRTSKVPILGVWGKNDVIFVPAGLEAFKRDSPDAELHFLDGGHFLVESHWEEIGELFIDFLRRRVPS